MESSQTISQGDSETQRILPRPFSILKSTATSDAVPDSSNSNTNSNSSPFTVNQLANAAISFPASGREADTHRRRSSTSLQSMVFRASELRAVAPSADETENDDDDSESVVSRFLTYHPLRSNSRAEFNMTLESGMINGYAREGGRSGSIDRSPFSASLRSGGVTNAARVVRPLSLHSFSGESDGASIAEPFARNLHLNAVYKTDSGSDSPSVRSPGLLRATTPSYANIPLAALPVPSTYLQQPAGDGDVKAAAFSFPHTSPPPTTTTETAITSPTRPPSGGGVRALAGNQHKENPMKGWEIAKKAFKAGELSSTAPSEGRTVRFTSTSTGDRSTRRIARDVSFAPAVEVPPLSPTTTAIGTTGGMRKLSDNGRRSMRPFRQLLRNANTLPPPNSEERGAPRRWRTVTSGSLAADTDAVEPLTIALRKPVAQSDSAESGQVKVSSNRQRSRADLASSTSSLWQTVKLDSSMNASFHPPSLQHIYGTSNSMANSGFLGEYVPGNEFS